MDLNFLFVFRLFANIIMFIILSIFIFCWFIIIFALVLRCFYASFPSIRPFGIHGMNEKNWQPKREMAVDEGDRKKKWRKEIKEEKKLVELLFVDCFDDGKRPDRIKIVKDEEKNRKWQVFSKIQSRFTHSPVGQIYFTLSHFTQLP